MHPIPYISLLLSINVNLKNPNGEIGCSLPGGKIGKCLKYEQCESLKIHRELYTEDIIGDCYNGRHEPMICCIATEDIKENEHTDETTTTTTTNNDNETTSNDLASTCILPDDLSAECVNIEECESLNNNSNKYNETVLNEISKPCKLNGQNKICCPSMEQQLVPTRNECKTPDGQQGECIKFDACDDFVRHIGETYNVDIRKKMFRELRCEATDSAKICCALTSSNDSSEMIDENNINSVDDEETVCVPSAEPYKLNSSCCGQTNGEARIMGGSETQINAYPWLGMIEYDNKILNCGVVLISGMYALTAAHCFYLSEAKPKYIWLGKYNIKTEKRDCMVLDGGRVMCNNGALKVPIENIFNRKQSSKKRRDLEDIAIVKFSEMVNFTEFIHPICLPEIDESANFTSNTIFKAAGWGLVDLQNRVLSDVKRHVSLPYVPLNKCEKEYGKLSNNQICAGGEEGQDSCNGDSGGPLMYKSPNLSLVYQVIGITSFSHSCGLRDVPGVYTKVFPVLPWIYKTINESKEKK
ncbi:PREDICTED: serine protease easter-like [Papilio polytes]|uniref:serine protease easter-like n=1 Tax=Papilio polytes TaxID=76194 RepID=UPI0006765B21|nr:PREDICTED: serine protease easter-like [Papilio polytes]